MRAEASELVGGVKGARSTAGQARELKLRPRLLTHALPPHYPPPPLAQVDHELSVPAVKLMLLSCVAHVGITWSQLLLHDRLSGTAKAALRWGALLGAVAFNFAVRARCFEEGAGWDGAGQGQGKGQGRCYLCAVPQRDSACEACEFLAPYGRA